MSSVNLNHLLKTVLESKKIEEAQKWLMIRGIVTKMTNSEAATHLFEYFLTVHKTLHQPDPPLHYFSQYNGLADMLSSAHIEIPSASALSTYPNLLFPRDSDLRSTAVYCSLDRLDKEMDERGKAWANVAGGFIRGNWLLTFERILAMDSSSDNVVVAANILFSYFNPKRMLSVLATRSREGMRFLLLVLRAQL